MKVWEEEWALDEDGIRLPDDRGFPVTVRGSWTTREQERLASAAPDLARALLAVATVTKRDGNCTWEECVSCGSQKAECFKGCALDTALRKAGVR